MTNSRYSDIGVDLKRFNPIQDEQKSLSRKEY